MAQTAIMVVLPIFITQARGIGTCLRVGGQDQKWGANNINFKGKDPIFKEFWCNFCKSGGRGAVAPSPAPYFQHPCKQCVCKLDWAHSSIWLQAIKQEKGNFSHPLCGLGNKGKYQRTISMHGINSSPVHIETPCLQLRQVAKQLLPKCKLEPRFFLRYFIPSTSAVHIKVMFLLGCYSRVPDRRKYVLDIKLEMNKLTPWTINGKKLYNFLTITIL